MGSFGRSVRTVLNAFVAAAVLRPVAKRDQSKKARERDGTPAGLDDMPAWLRRYGKPAWIEKARLGKDRVKELYYPDEGVSVGFVENRRGSGRWLIYGFSDSVTGDAISPELAARRLAPRAASGSNDVPPFRPASTDRPPLKFP